MHQARNLYSCYMQRVYSQHIDMCQICYNIQEIEN